ncbi:hypothetical protein [Limisphaera sp. 4302-co]|uniref:hypothetical protein n=1 Tax=Limisphaera sp. 4302-co TaxID=3400417 RepID=UPI003C2813B5
MKTAQIGPYVRLHEEGFVVRSNHLHGIIWIVEDDVVEAGRRAPTRRHPGPTADCDATLERFGAPVSGSIPTIVRAFKSATTKRIDALRGTPGGRAWQRNYYEDIVQNEKSLNRVSECITEPPTRWAWDRENPETTTPEPESA